MAATPPYPRAPVALAVIEVKHPTVDLPTNAEVAALKGQLVKHFPIQRYEEMTHFSFGPGGPHPPRVQRMPRFVSRDRQSSVTFRTDAVVVETTRYPGWTAFKPLIEAALLARQDVAPVDGVERIGLRYIDEIRIPDEPEPDWSTWVDPSLTGPSIDVSTLGLHMQQQQSVVQYATANPGETLTLRYGAIIGPPVVQSNPNLVRLNLPGPGHYFLLDTDAAWSLTDAVSVPAFEAGEVISVANQLHGPMKALFERLITPKLREEVLNVG